MTQEQEKALKIVENLISNIGCHPVTAEEIMILMQGIMSNDCGGCNWKYVQVPQYQPGLEPDRHPGYRPGDVWCGDNLQRSLYATDGTTTLDELQFTNGYFKGEKEMIEEARKKYMLNENEFAEFRDKVNLVNSSDVKKIIS